jgi:hypothetical protein
VSATVVSCIYGDRYRPFVDGWADSVHALDPRPDHVVVAGDDAAGLPAFVAEVIGQCPWLYPQAFYLHLAISTVQTEWVWILDIDDRALPGALEGLEDVDADVLMCGYLRSDGEVYVPPPLTAEDVLVSPRNLIPAGSMIRTEAFKRCGGFLDVALQDWGLWRSLASCGATFQTSGDARYLYNRHPQTRGARELTVERRPLHLAEMVAAEGAVGVA